ncbi:MAG: RluA family pseudouridine synthase, partial [Oscillospiraceae bacterium]|nr:RluA family pseudouridine synthase [Oscillospiraceae bacterium]
MNEVNAMSEANEVNEVNEVDVMSEANEMNKANTVKSFTVTALDDNQRLNRYLMKTVPLLSGTLMYRYLRTGHIKVNGKKIKADYRLKRGDKISLYFSDEFFEVKEEKLGFLNASRILKIIYQDKNIAILQKESGLLSHSDISTDDDTLINRFLRHLYEKGEYDPSIVSSFTPALCNRLDKDTEGLVIAAKTPKALRELNLMIRNQHIIKEYLAVVSAKPPKDGIYYAYLKDNPSAGAKGVVVSDKEDDRSKQIMTGIQSIYADRNLYVVRVELITGRKHQIRAHLAHLGCPVLGDVLYGDKQLARKYTVDSQILMSHKVSFSLANHSADYPTLKYLDGRSYEIKNAAVSFCRKVDNLS